MYSPKIKEELIPKVYEISKAMGIRMTTLVNEILWKALDEMEKKGDRKTDEDGGHSIKVPGLDQGLDSNNNRWSCSQGSKFQKGG